MVFPKCIHCNCTLTRSFAAQTEKWCGKLKTEMKVHHFNALQSIEKRTIHCTCKNVQTHGNFRYLYENLDRLHCNKYPQKTHWICGKAVRKQERIYLKVKSSPPKLKIYMNLSPIKYISFYSPSKKISNKLGNYLKRDASMEGSGGRKRAGGRTEKSCKFSFLT